MQLSISCLLLLSILLIFSLQSGYTNIGLPVLGSAYAQNLIPYTIQIISSSSYIDSLGNYHIIGEVNNTSTIPQNNVQITSILYDSFNNVIGNASTFSSLEVLRPGELSPFDIIIDNPEIVNILGYFDFITTSQPSQEKPAYLFLNISNTYTDNFGNPHIAGDVINHGEFLEPFVPIIGTFYNNFSQVIGTQVIFITLNNLTQSQLTPFDIGIFDNTTKFQSNFFSLKTESPQYSMEYPIDSKWVFPLNNYASNSLINDPILNSDQVFSSNNDGQSSTFQQFDTKPDIPSTITKDLDIGIKVGKNPISPGNIQTVVVTVSDSKTDEKISGANVVGKVKYASNSFDNDGEFNKVTNNNGQVEHDWEIGGNSKKGIFEVIVDVNANGYKSASKKANFEVVFANKTTDNIEIANDNNTSDIDKNNTITNNNNEGNDGNNPGEVTDETCPDGFQKNPSGDCEAVNSNSNNGDNEDSNNDGSGSSD
ncbi:MAG: hypothetical protein H0X03_06935, partial [Nitrosopumilus sp.]|nr:hypothetical protein [Nitrosopumilus sp.]